MGKASSSKKIKRVQAAGATRSPGQRRELGFPAVIIGIIVVGLVLTALAVMQRRDTEEVRPTVDDNWVAAYGTYICSEFIGNLPTVAEGAAYTEKNWGDQTEIGNWVKKGNFLGLTLEAIDRDDTRRLQQTPRALAQAAWMSLGKAFTRIFTNPPAMSDGKALFHVDHNNLGSSPLSYAAFDATRTLMAAQTELNSDEPLGGLTVPRYLMVSRAREGLSLQVLASEGEPGTANNDVNPYAEGNTHEARLAAAKRRVIVNDFLAAPDDWYAIADPMMYPSIGLGFRYGRTPEIISTADPGAYYMFTQDVMPIKVRWFFVVGPTDWRGVFKHVVV